MANKRGNMTEAEDIDAMGKKLVEGLYKNNMILTWYKDKPQGWTLFDGQYSPFYINLRLICSSDPELYRLAGKAMSLLLKKAGFVADGKHRIVGVAMAGIPLANAATLEIGIPSLYTRKLPAEVKDPVALDTYIKSHGQHTLVEGQFFSGDKLAIVDDLVATFKSKLLVRSQIEWEISRRALEGVRIDDVFVLLDREQGAVESAKKAGMNVHSLVPFVSKGLEWLKDSLSKAEYDTIKDYLQDPKKYQNKEIQEKLQAIALEK